MGNKESGTGGLGDSDIGTAGSGYPGIYCMACSAEAADSAEAAIGKDESRGAQIRATVYGQCIGDAIGLLTEFMGKADAKRIYKGKDLEYKLKIVDSHRKRWATGDWTDDSDQMFLLLLSLLQHGGQVNVQDFAKRMKQWVETGFAELGDTGGNGVGRLTYSVLRHYKFVKDPHLVAQDVWDTLGRNAASNGGVMRTSIVGTHCWWDVDRVQTTALDFVRCTHHDKRCQASAVAVSVCISLMLQRQPRHVDKKGHYNVDALIEESFSHAAACLEKEEDKQELRQFMDCTDVKELKLTESGKIGYTYKTLGCGFWALKKNHFRKAIQEIVMEGGDADTNACVAGAMLGCKLGLDEIPDSWKTGLKHKDWLDQHIDSWLLLQTDLASQQPTPQNHEQPTPQNHEQPTPQNHEQPTPQNHEQPTPQNHEQPTPQNHEQPTPENHEQPTPENHEQPTPQNHEQPTPQNHEQPTPQNHEQPTPENHEQPTPQNHEQPTPQNHEQPTPQNHEQPTPEDCDKPTPQK